MADLKISQLPELSGAALQSDDVLAVADLSASETKKIKAKDLVQASLSQIDNGSIPSDKIDGSLAPESIGSVELADGSVTAAKLADESTAVVVTALPAAGAYTGQLGFNSTTNQVSIWDGSTWQPTYVGIEAITGGQVGDVTTTVTTVGAQVSVIAEVDNSTVAAQFLAGPTAAGGPVLLRGIVPGDLPTATATTPGILAVPSGGGLTIQNGDEVVIDNNIVGSGAAHLVTYTEKGLVNSGRAIQGSDLPLATTSSVGVISAAPGEFTVSPAGQLKLANQISGSTFPVITFNDQGLVTSGRELDESDIPELPASKITSGQFDSSQLADGSVTKEKIADYAISYIQEASPSVTDPGHIGVLWYQESTGQLRMWNGNSWMPVGFGRLSNDNLRWGGIIDASTGLVTGVTSSGTNAGLKIGEALPTATDNLGGLYVVASVGGDQITVTPGVTYDAGDWCLCINKAEGWVRIDTLSSGGGGGGASTLGELLDVTLTAEAEGEFLQLQATGQWSNIEVTPDTIGALKPGDNVSELVNDAGYLTSATLPPGADLWDVDSGAIYPSTTTNDVHIGGTLPGTPNISLNADGSSIFGEYNQIQLLPGLDGNDNGYGSIVVYGANNVGNECFKVFDGSGTRFSVRGDGSAIFAGNIGIGGTLPSAPNISLNADGTASFASGTTKTLTTDIIAVGSGSGIITGIVEVQGNRAGSSTAFSVRPTDASSGPTIALNADGTSAFENTARITYANSTVYSPTSGAKESGSLLLTNNDNTSVNGLSAGLRMVATGSGNNASAFIGTVNTDSDGNAAIVFCPRTNSIDSGAPSAGEAERMRIDSSGNILIGGTLPSAPNITLNADGSASFTKAVNVANYFADTGGIQINENGVFIRSNDSYEKVFTVVSDGTAANNEVITFERDGSAIFKGDYILVGSNPGNSADNTSGITAGVPGIVINRDSTKSDSDYAFVVTKHSGSGTTYAETARINNNGSATFAGYLKTTSFFSSTRTQGTDGCFSGYLNSTQTSKIYADGSATFGGTGLVDISNPAYLNGAQIGSRIRFLNTNGDPAANAETWATITINGSPGFAQAGPLLFQVKTSATDDTQRTIAGVSTFGFNVYDPNPYVGNDFNVKVLLGTDGNITAENVTFKLEPDDNSNYTTTIEEYTETETYEGPRGRTLEREVTKTREVKTYTGPTMDVKDTLLKITEALTQLKAAAASATTCEELRTAIDTALADV